ncbi:10198_t:CDS:2 [Funneliformis mosseae]|uniref:10198_t:CDS:1 n=1 Tax=Funneliformis mosseae TaxID=27381 RepID=A0A9N8WH97_FUNMO|nr:10198_t:CDS:2 [Funneliformis mosseae]
MSTITHTFYLCFAVPISGRKEHQFISALQRATIELRPAVQPVKVRVSTPVNAVVTQETMRATIELRPAVQPVKVRVSTPVNAVVTRGLVYDQLHVLIDGAQGIFILNMLIFLLDSNTSSV